MGSFKRHTGFTLIELMIVVAVIGILAGIAYPSYKSYILKAKRSDAKAALLKAQLAQEKYRTNNVTYGTLAQIGINTTSPDGYYTIAVVGTPDATTYRMTAVPVATDATCGTFAINESGAYYTGYANASCWGK